jgi:arylsulfatase
VWAEPFTQLRLQKIYNLFQDPFERADITSNTYWDWNLNQIGAVYGAMDEVFQFAATFNEFPPRAFPPSFVPSTILGRTIDKLREAQEKAQDDHRDSDVSADRSPGRARGSGADKRPPH